MAAGGWEKKEKEKDAVEVTEMDRCFAEVLTGRIAASESDDSTYPCGTLSL